jgi:hypothetical protein
MSIKNNEHYKELRSRLFNLETEYAKNKLNEAKLSIIEKEIKAVNRELGQLLFSLKDNERNKSKEGELSK